MQVVRTVFPDKLISHFGDINWPTCSPDLAVPGYFLYGYFKAVYTKFVLHKLMP